MKHMVICIGRQYGSGGREIGERLAQKPGINCCDKLLIKKNAEISGLNEEYISREEEKPESYDILLSSSRFCIEKCTDLIIPAISMMEGGGFRE